MTAMSRIQQRAPLVLSASRQLSRTRWLALGGVVGPLLFVATFTLAGALRPGYSPIHQTISDLGVGPNAWLLNVSLVVNCLLLSGFAVGWALAMRSVLSPGWRWLGAGLLSLHGLGQALAGAFTEAPATLAIHSTVGAPLAFFGPVVAFLVVGFALLHDARWRRWGIGLLAAGLATLAIVVVMFWVFTPGTPLASLHLGGLMERALFVEVEAWYAALGWRLRQGERT